MRRAIFLSGVILLASFQNATAANAAAGWPSAPATGAGETRAFELTDEMRSKIKSAVSESLKDPATARIADRIVAVRTESGIHVCGRANIKHSSDAFTGAKPFYVMGNRAGSAFALVSMGGTLQADERVRLLCSVHGIK